MIEFDFDEDSEQIDMMIPCNSCGGRAVVRSRRAMAAQYFEVYVICKDPHCAASDKWGVQHIKNISPSAEQHQQSLFTAVNALDDTARQQLLDQLNRDKTESTAPL